MIEINATPQATTEIRTHFIDFTNDLPDGVTVSSASATLTGYPVGGSATLAVGVISDNVVPVTVTAPTPAGVFYVDVTAALSDGETSLARLIIPVSWTTTRSGMVDLIQKLRAMTNTGVSDFQVGGEWRWSDGHLQEALDNYSAVIDFEDLTAFAQRAGSAAYIYRIYDSHLPNWESPAVIMDEFGGTISSGYTFNYATGRCTFTADQAGSARTISGTAYNLNLAAAEVWRFKASYYAEAYDISTDNHNLRRSQLVAQAKERAAYYSALGRGGQSISVERSDM